MLHQKMASELTSTDDTRLIADRSDQQFAIILKPVSHPDLGDIRIDDSLFAIGRSEPPFAAYPPATVADLSRRQARIFVEYGAVYIADLDSKNGTTVNGINVQKKITRLQNGDEICFGRALSFRVQLGSRTDPPTRTDRLSSLTLRPVRDDLDLQPIVITRFPFLISKADETFSRYKNAFPHQVNYLSRRHAHIFLKNGIPFIEDLGSTNGTFVGENRLEERAVALEDGDTIAFGGHHFVYHASLQKQQPETEPTITRMGTAPPGTPLDAGDVDKTTFVAAANSFLDIFCVDHGQQQGDEVNQKALPAPQHGGPGADKRRARGRFQILMGELLGALWTEDRRQDKRMAWVGGALAAGFVVLVIALFFNGSSERKIKDLLASGDFAQAATIAGKHLQRDSSNLEIKAFSTEATLKANLPSWIAALKARDFAGTERGIAGMKALVADNTDAQSLVAELEWVGNLEKYISARGGPEAPVRDAADEAAMKGFLKQWDDDTSGHQRALVTISSYVPEFRDVYAEALSHLRKLALTGGRRDQG